MAWWNNWLGKTIDLNESSAGFWGRFFGAGTPSGETVTLEKALGLDAFWACVNLIQDSVGTLPCVLYDADGITAAKNDGLYGLLHDLPNADDTASEFWSMVAFSLCTDGNFFAEKIYVGERLVALNPLNPCAVAIKRDDRNNRYYEYNQAYGNSKNTEIRRIAEDRMFHVRWRRMPECDRGLSPLWMLKNIIGSALSGEGVAGKILKDGLLPQLIISSDQILKPEQRTQIHGVLEEFSKSGGKGGILPLEAGMTPHALNINPKDAQMLETRQYSVEQICRIFGVPPVMIGHAANGTTTWGSGIEQLILQFSKTCLRPMLQRVEDAIYRDILTPEQRKTRSVKFNMDAFLEGDSVARANFLTKMSDSGIYTKNEARAYENKPPIKGGDNAIVNGTMTRLDKLGETPAPQPANSNEPVPAAPKKAA